MRKWALIYPLVVLFMELLLFAGSLGGFVYVGMRFVLMPFASVALLVWMPIVGWAMHADDRRDQVVWCLVLFLEAVGFLIAIWAFPVPWIPRPG